MSFFLPSVFPTCDCHACFFYADAFLSMSHDPWFSEVEDVAHEWGLAYSENGLHRVIWLGCPIGDYFQTLQMFSPVMVVAPKEASFSLWPGGRKPKSRHSRHRRRQMFSIRVGMCLAVSGEEIFSLLYGRNELVPFGSLWPRNYLWKERFILVDGRKVVVHHNGEGGTQWLRQDSQGGGQWLFTLDQEAEREGSIRSM